MRPARHGPLADWWVHEDALRGGGRRERPERRCQADGHQCTTVHRFPPGFVGTRAACERARELGSAATVFASATDGVTIACELTMATWLPGNNRQNTVEQPGRSPNSRAHTARVILGLRDAVTRELSGCLTTSARPPGPAPERHHAPPHCVVCERGRRDVRWVG